MTSRLRRPLLAAALLASPLGCRPPTEAVLDITTDADPRDVGQTDVFAGLLEDLDKPVPDGTTTGSDATGQIGSIVLLPSTSDRTAPFAFKVVTALGSPAAPCVEPVYGPNCIVVRRAMRFIPRDPFHVAVRMSQACAGVSCPEHQTCVDGTCRSEKVDCAGDSCEPPPTTVPPWQHQLGGLGQQLASHLALGADGTLVATGSFDDQIDWGGPFTSVGKSDIFIATYSPEGQLRWATTFGGTGNDLGASVAIDAHANVFLLASFQDSVAFVPPPGAPLASAGTTDLALVKMTSFGKVVWAISLGGASGGSPGAVAVDDAGNAYVAGGFSGSVTLGQTKLDSAGSDDGFIAAFSPAGDVRWAKALGGAGADGANGVAVDGAGNVHVGGFFQGQADVSGQVLSAPLPSDTDAFVASFDLSGKFRWAKSFGSKGHDILLGLAARGERVVATGAVGGAATIDGASLSTSQTGAGFVVALDGAGKLAWSQAVGTNGLNLVEAVSIAPDGSIALGGELLDGSAFGSPPLPNMGVGNPFVVLLAPDGKPRWTHARTYAASMYARATGVAAPGDGDAYLAGYFVQTLDVDGTTLTSGGDEDMFLWRGIAPVSRESREKRQRTERAVALALLSLFVVYVGDTLSVKYRIPGDREPIGEVTVVGDHTIAKKYGKVEYVYGEPLTLSCVHALFPHYSESPCWYVQLTGGGRTAPP